MLQNFLGNFAGKTFVAQVDQDQVVISTTRDQVIAFFQEVVGQRLSVADDLFAVDGELGLECFAKGDGLACDHVHERATL